jgi:cellulose synthase/poly-beta-1,6-N-acetylglucosamine synthase-like glycosyltransferase
MMIFVKILFYLLTAYTAFSVLYIFVYSMASPWRKSRKTLGESKKNRCIIYIPAYKEDVVILEVALKASQQNYPQELYDVVVIADSLQEKTLEKLRAMPIRVVVVSFDKSTKAKALNVALAQTEDIYDLAFVIDADNIMEPDFLLKINQSYNAGFKAIQGHRVAKNTNTAVSLLDAVSEEINNSIFRQGHRALGVSSAFIGSGLAIEYPLFKTLMKDVSSVGEDKELELFLLRQGYTIEYVADAMVYDEKIQEYGNMVNQRRRWLFAQFDFFGKFFFAGFGELFRGNFGFFDKVIQQGLLPRSILIGICGLIAITGLVFLALGINPGTTWLPQVWLAIIIMLILALAIAIPRKFYTFRLLRAMLYLPKGIVIMFISLVKSRFSGNTFFHTKHGVDES